MVGNIKKGMLAGSQMLTEPKVTWRQGIGEAIVGAVDKAAQAKQQFDEREKNLVWSRLDLEAANLQAEELESIRTAGSIEDVLAIKKDFESKIKANMDGQKWGKEWIEQKGSSYFTANQNDVAKAFRAKEKELLSIQLEKNLELYADAIARSDGEQAELLKQKALGEMGNLKGLLSPTEEHKTITNFDEIIKAKKNDILSQQKRMAEQKKQEGIAVQSDTWRKVMLGEVGEEYIMKQMPNFHNPKVAIEMIKYLKDDDTALTDDQKAFVGNAGNMSVEEIYKVAETKGYPKKVLDIAITKQSRIKKERDETEKDVAEVEKEKREQKLIDDLIDEAYSGKDMNDKINQLVAKDVISAEAGNRVLSINKKYMGASQGLRSAYKDIQDGIITSAASIREKYAYLSKEEKEEAITYLKDVKERKGDFEKETLKKYAVDARNKAVKGELSFDQIKAMRANGLIDEQEEQYLNSLVERVGGFSDGYKTVMKQLDKIKSKYDLEEMIRPLVKEEKDIILKQWDNLQTKKTQEQEEAYNDLAVDASLGYLNEDDDEFKSQTAEKQNALRKLRDDANNARVDTQYNKVYGEILSGNIQTFDALRGYIDSEGLDSLSYDKEKLASLDDIIAKKKEDKNGVLTKALSYVNYLPDGDSPAEIKAREKFRNQILETFDGNKSSQDLMDEYSPENMVNLVNTLKPSQEDIVSSYSKAAFNKQALKTTRDGLFSEDDDGNLVLNKDATLPSLLNYSYQLDGGLADEQIDSKEHQERQLEVGKALSEKIKEINDKSKGKSVLGNLYALTSRKIAGEDKELSYLDSVVLIRDIYTLMGNFGIPKELKIESLWDWWRDNEGRISGAIKDYNKTVGKEYQKTEVDIHFLKDQVLRRFAVSKGLKYDDDMFYYNNRMVSINSVKSYNQKLAKEDIDVSWRNEIAADEKVDLTPLDKARLEKEREKDQARENNHVVSYNR